MKNLYTALIDVLGDNILLMETTETPNQLLVQLSCNYNIDHNVELLNRFKQLQPESYLDVEEGLGPREYKHQTDYKFNSIETISIEIKPLIDDTEDPSITLSPETRKNIAELDTMLQTLKEDLEDNYPIDEHRDDTLADLYGDLDNMQNKITAVQSEQNWI